MEVVCKIAVLVEEIGVILWTGRDEDAIRKAASRKYAGRAITFGEPRYVEGSPM